MATRTPNQQLKELVAESGLTYAAMAKAVRAVAAECGTSLRTNKSTVEHWIAGVTPHGDTGRYLAVALSRRLGRLLTPADLGLAESEEDDSIGLALGADPIDALLPMWRFELDRRHFLTSSAYSVAAAALPLTYVEEIADRTAAARFGHTVGMAEVAAVRDMVRVFSEMDERHGGQHGRSALCSTCATMSPPCAGAASALRKFASTCFPPPPAAYTCWAGSPTTLVSRASRSAITCSPMRSPSSPTSLGTTGS
ncbi:hypothetical protein ACPCUV_29630 [Streptomyces platensis]|uniref:hypothetical protein n=1 Tax=Streptomyces platensis TaxID=58346 RepID=UPI003C2C9103